MIVQLQRAAGFDRDDDGDAKLDKLVALLAAGMLPGTESRARQQSVSLIASMMSLPVERYPPLNLTPQKQKELTFDSLSDQVAWFSCMGT